jgi:hypothetical protein
LACTRTWRTRWIVLVTTTVRTCSGGTVWVGTAAASREDSGLLKAVAPKPPATRAAAATAMWLAYLVTRPACAPITKRPPNRGQRFD